MQVVFVCTGNTCRSPMATWLFNDKIAQRGLANYFNAQSAGIFVTAGLSASEQAIHIIKDLGGDLTQHRSQPLTKELLLQSDLTLTMTDEQKHHILKMYPDITVDGRDKSLENLKADKNYKPILLLSEYAAKAYEQIEEKMTVYDNGKDKNVYDIQRSSDITDPIGGTREDYSDVFSELEQLITVIVDYLAITVE